jgi:hypothetical protein
VKLRLAENSLRLRLSPDEVTSLGARDAVEAAVRLTPDDPAPFTYRLELRASGEPGVHRDAGGLVVALPREAARAWIAGDAPGVYLQMPTAGTPLALILETDLRP